MKAIFTSITVSRFVGYMIIFSMINFFGTPPEYASWQMWVQLVGVCIGGNILENCGERTKQK